MTVWETEDEYASAAQASLPTPNDTPYRTPSRTSRSSRKKSKSPVQSSSPPGYRHGEDGKRGSKDITNDETISILDPRRFTPTLHANLVSEILTLRRDQEEKIRLIENLEASLHESRNETEELVQSLSSTGKETRSLKRQLALLEGGTSSALGELARERDEAVETASETKKRLEAALKKSRAQEDESDRTHDLWGRDKDNWDDEKRKLERRVHVAENRLKTVLEEVAAYQASHQTAQVNGEVSLEDQSNEIGMGQGSDTASVRTMSLTNSIRFSLLNGPNGYGGSKLNGVSLADELNLETEDDEESQTDNDGRESAMSLAHRRNQSRDSMVAKTHRRGPSMDSLRRPGSVARGRLLANQAVLERLTGGIVEDDETPIAEKPVYVDTGVQFSPPSSPQLKAVILSGLEIEPIEEPIQPEIIARSQAANEHEIEANQARKRVHTSPPLIIEPPSSRMMVSSSAQTLGEEPLSPPRTPKTPTREPPPPPPSMPPPPPPGIDMVSMSTQTDDTILPPVPNRASPLAPPPLMSIPSISVHPPTSRPSTPRVALLPQHFKDAGCQVWMPLSDSIASVGVQTESIRVDERLNFLPKHLQPSSITSTPPTPEPREDETDRFTPVPGNAPPPRNPRRMKSQQSITDIPSSPPEPLRETYDAYPGNNDDGPLSKEKVTLRRPHRISSLFAGFDAGSSDEADDFADADMSDNENGFRTALSAPRPKAITNKLSKRATPTSVPEDEEPLEEVKPRQAKSNRVNGNYDSNGNFTLQEAPSLSSSRNGNKSNPRSSFEKAATAKQGTMRRAALIQNGIAAHQGRSRSPSLPEPVKEPPFPIPTRASSRKPPFSVSAPSDGNRSPTPRGGDGWHRRGSRNHNRTSSIRKVRSAAQLPGQRYRRTGSRSPPPFSPSTEAPESPQLPPMPRNDITTPQYSDAQATSRYAVHRQQPSTNTAISTNTNAQSVGSSTQATSVVDAIAQTMVGEWMFKYVRRRKSFGVSENNAFEAENGVNGVRHKRWVWLAPYERAVMWSSKQPTSGSALMGKSGRKLAIQSVLDVKDDNPPPKGSPGIFNRSILILTPARALKFTATTRERHYTWLTALSFLAHSSQAIPEIISAPPPIPLQQAFQHSAPQFEIPNIPSKSKLRKSSIRDSIRVAKGKAPALPAMGSRSNPPSQQGGSVTGGGALSIRTDDSMQLSSVRGEGGPVSTTGTANSNSTFWRDPLPHSAVPPVVPRFTEREYPGSHGRKRSNTGSRIPPPLSFRGFNDRSNVAKGPLSSDRETFSSAVQPFPGHAQQASTAGMSVGTNGSSDLYQQSSISQRSSSYGASVWGNGGIGSTNGMSSVRTSDASNRPGGVVNNFFDAVGTVRMEAFISPLSGPIEADDYLEEEREDWFSGIGNSKRRSKDLGSGSAFTGGRRKSRERIGYANGGRRRSGNRESIGKLGIGRDDWYSGSKTAGEEEYGYRGRESRDDPFRGF